MSALERYLAALRDELAVQFRGADIDRIVEEVESHLLAAIDEAGADSDAEIDTVLGAFGSPAVVGNAYRQTGIRAIGVDSRTKGPTGARQGNERWTERHIAGPLTLIGDLMNLSQIFRNLARHPGFAAVTIATLALGIAANAVILSVVNGVLLEPLPYPGADRIVQVYHSAPGLNVGMDNIGLSEATYYYFRDEGVLEDLALYDVGAANLTGGEEPRRVTSVSVSHSFFETLGVPPLLGRSFNETDGEPGAPRVVLLSESLWRESFGGRTDAVGETVMMDAESAEIVGVMPASITFPDPEADLYEVRRMAPAPNRLGSLGVTAIGRMPPGMTVEEASAQLAARVANLQEAFPDESAAPLLQQAGFTTHVMDLRQAIVRDVEQALWLLLGSVGFILLIACANVANVYLVRAEAREREMAIRAAIGAGRGRLALGLLIESALLGLVAGGIGLLLAYAGVRALVRFEPQNIPRLEQIGLDGPVIGATLLIAVLAGLLFGVIPALRYNAAWLARALKESGRGHTGGRGRFRLRSVLVGAQVALALVLLVGSGLMARSYASLATVELGFNPDSMLTFRVMLNRNDYPGEEAPARFIQSVIDELSSMPGVTGVAATNGLPLGGLVSGSGFAIEDRPLADDALPPVHFYKHASAGYFETMEIPVVAGRDFERTDHEERRDAVIVNEAFARLYWPEQDPIGRRIQRNGGGDPPADYWYRIVGVVGDTRGNAPPSGPGTGLLEQAPTPLAYFPLVAIEREAVGENSPPDFGPDIRNAMFAVRTSGNPGALVEPVRRRIGELDGDLPIAAVRTMDEIVARAMAQKSFTMLLLLVGAAGALLIGAVGIYGVISYVVTQQTREIGVRMALGARAGDIRRMVLGRSLAITAGGVLAGVLGAWSLTRFMGSLLYGVDPLDPATFAAVIVTLIAVAALAAYLPARRAARTDPLEVLRHE